jgi:hypothetical protein
VISNPNALLSMGSPALPANVEPGLFGPIEMPSHRQRGASPGTKAPIRGTRPVLSWPDFVLPELVIRTENGDLAVKAVSSSEQEEQTLHLLSAAQESSGRVDKHRERKLYAQALKRDPDEGAALQRFLLGESEAEAEFHLWLLRRVDRKARALECKANRLAACSVIARPMDCMDCGLKAFLRFYCGNRYCRYCGNQIFVRLSRKMKIRRTICCLVDPGPSSSLPSTIPHHRGTLCVKQKAPIWLRDSEHVNTPRCAARLLSRGT